MSLLKNLILRTRGKQDVLRAVDFIGTDSKNIEEIVSLSLSNDEKISMKASWVLRYVAEKNKGLITPYLDQIVNRLDSCSFSCQRSLLNILEYYKSIPEDLEDATYHACFTILLNKSAPIANHACSMNIASSICLKYPELSNELILVIEDLLPNGSPGVKNRGKKTIQLLRKIKN